MKILPDEIPDDAVPLTDAPTDFTTNRLNDVLVDGENVFVTLLTGKFYVGVLEWVSDAKFTVGQSAPIDRALVESARIV